MAAVVKPMFTILDLLLDIDDIRRDGKKPGPTMYCSCWKELVNLNCCHGLCFWFIGRFKGDDPVEMCWSPPLPSSCTLIVCLCMRPKPPCLSHETKRKNLVCSKMTDATAPFLFYGYQSYESGQKVLILSFAPCKRAIFYSWLTHDILSFFNK